MFNTTNLIKLGASAAAALLILLFANWAASAMYTVGEDFAHGEDEHEPTRGFVIAAMDTEAAASEEPVVEVDFGEVYAAADAAAGEGEFKACKSCHKLEEGANGTGPSLYGVVGRPIASVADFGYSDALLALSGESWTPEHLNDWIHDPKAYAPGNKMTYKGMKKIEDRANLIAYLATIGG
ncbi:MAG: cytochrome c family protein [Maritimibacter sp.]|nr:cytochrome c family protein [Maritimibacter sp.]